MKKILLAGAGVITLAIAATPGLIGNNLESEFHQTIKAVDDHQLLSVQITSYKKGWFSTEATIEVALDLTSIAQAYGDVENTENPSFEVGFIAHHGPLYMGDTMGVGRLQYEMSVEGENLPEQLSWDKSLPFYAIRGLVSLAGTHTYKDELTAFVLKDDSSVGELTFTGYSGASSVNGGLVNYQGGAEGLTFSSPEFEIDLQNLTVSMDWNGDFVAALAGELYESIANMSVDKINVSGVQLEEDIVVEHLKMDTSTELDEAQKHTNMMLSYSIDALKVPDYQASDIKLSIEAKNLETEFLKAYQAFSNEAVGMTEEQQAQRLQSLMDNQLLPFLAASPELNITALSAKLQEGGINAHINSKLEGITALPDALENPRAWLEYVLADAKVTADEAVTKMLIANYVKSQLMQNPQAMNMTPEELDNIVTQQVSGVLASFTEQGFITLEGAQYQAEASLKKGIALLNGNQIPLGGG